MSNKITPCLWFDDQGEDAAKFYVSIFKNSKITSVSRYGEAGKEVHGKKPGTAMMVAFELDGHKFSWLMSGDPQKAGRAMQALMKMQKLDIAKLQAAYDGK